MKNISLIVAHFYDFAWIELWIEQLRRNTDMTLVQEILIINQDRTFESHRLLAKLDPKVKVLEYPISQSHFSILGHDHPAVLNLAIKEASGDYLVIFDSDAHPIINSWINICDNLLEHYDAILALNPGSVYLTHPCFMVLKRVQIGIPLSFDQGLFTKSIDTGRLIGEQLKSANQKVYLIPAVRGFNGLWGWLYLDAIYHHQSASFAGGDERLRSQIRWESSFFKTIVVKKNKYSLSKFERSIFYFIRFLRRRKKYFLYHISRFDTETRKKW